jgi:hypothetical protein
MQHFAGLLFAILILCTLSIAGSVAGPAQEQVAYGGGPPVSSSDSKSDNPKLPYPWTVECRSKDLKKKCRPISQCDHAGVVSSLIPECEEKCICRRGSTRFASVRGMAGPGLGEHNHASRTRKLMEERRKKELKELNEAMRLAKTE